MSVTSRPSDSAAHSVSFVPRLSGEMVCDCGSLVPHKVTAVNRPRAGAASAESSQPVGGASVTWGRGMLAACRLATQADTVWDPCCREDLVTECSGICEMSLGSVCGGQKVSAQNSE